MTRQLALRVRELRQGLKLSQSKLATRARCSRATIIRIEQGSDALGVPLFLRLARVLGSTPDGLLLAPKAP